MLALAGALALALAIDAGVVGVAAVPPILRAAAVALALFALCGYPASRILIGVGLAPLRPLLILPLGVAVSSLALAVLGLLHVPFAVALAAVVAGGAVATVVALLRRPDRPVAATRMPFEHLALALALAALAGSISLIPSFRSGYPTVPGQNGDAILVVGSAELVEHAPPTATRLNLPINRIPLQWRSKYPIYYALAAVAALSGESPIAAFPTVSALILSLWALGLFAVARYALRAPPYVALLALLLAPLDRIVMYVTIHPYYNELWGQFTLPFILLAAWHWLTEPSRRSLGLLALFTLLGLLAYPLMLPFPLFFALAGGWIVWRRRRAEGAMPGWVASFDLPWLRRRPWLLIPALVVAVPVAAVLVRGFVEKALSAASVLLPGTSLAGWSGKALPYLPWPRFVGMPGAGLLDYAGMIVVCLLAAAAIYRTRHAAGPALAAMIGVAVLIGVYFRLRTGGQLFYFKDLAFAGPYVLLLALIELGALAASVRLRRWVVGVPGIAAALVVVPAGSAREIDITQPNSTPEILALHRWDLALARGTSVRIDVPPSGVQLWTTYMFNDHRLCALQPLGGFFPHPPQARKADYVIALSTQPRPADAAGTPLFHNDQFTLWRMSPSVPGPEVCSRRLVDINGIVTGF